MHPSNPNRWLYYVETPLGYLWIAPQPGTDRVWIGLGDEPLGSYASPMHAADDAAHGYSGYFKLDDLVRQRRLRIPDHHREWERGRLLAGGQVPAGWR